MNWSTAIKPFPSYLNLFLINKLNFYFYFLDSCSRHGWQSTCNCNPLALATQLKSTCNCNPLATHLQSTGNCNPQTIQWKMRSTGNCNPLAIHCQLQHTGNPLAIAIHLQSTGNCKPLAGQQQRQIKCSTQCARTHNAHCYDLIEKCHWHAGCQPFSPMLQMRCMVAYTRELQRCVRCNMCHAAGAVRMQYFAVVHVYLLANT